MNQSDPTDQTLAAIASILDQPESHHEPETAAAEEKPDNLDEPEPDGVHDAAGYSKLGPGPMAAIRFKWTVRRDDNGAYFVDETIGENSIPIVSGPMTADEAIKFVDDHEIEARQRFEQLKSEMTGPHPAATNFVQSNSGEM